MSLKAIEREAYTQEGLIFGWKNALLIWGPYIWGSLYTVGHIYRFLRYIPNNEYDGLSEFTIKSSYLNNYLKKLYCQAYCINFSFSLIRTAFVAIYKNIDRLLAWRYNLKNTKHLKKISEELMPI